MQTSLARAGYFESDFRFARACDLLARAQEAHARKPTDETADALKEAQHVFKMALQDR